MIGLRTSRQYPSLPSLPATGIMPPSIGVIIPIARTNLVTNPSIELATTGYTASGGSIARSSTQQYHGVYSLAVTPTAGTTDGAYYAIALTSGTAYAFSCKFRGIAGVPYKISIATTAPADLATFAFVGTGRWQWVWGYYLETSSTTRRFYITKNGSANTGIFYVDGLQVEAINAGETVSTYIDGDQTGLLVGQQPPPYLWAGTPHGSTSTRSILTRAGGYVLNLETAYNFLLTGIIGLGMATPNNVSIPYTVLDGARFLRTTKPPRMISLPGRFQADDVFTLQQSISDMRQAFDRDLMPIQQPMILTVEPRDECGTVIGDFAQVQCLYAGGLEGNDTNLPIQDAAPTFTMYIPFLIGGDTGAAPAVQQTVTNANAILRRSPTGQWSAMDSGMSSGGAIQVDAFAITSDGSVFAGGAFTGAGASGADNIARFDGTSWQVVGSATAIGNTVNALAVAPNGTTVYVGGFFINANGIAAADFIASWDGTNWAALSTGMAAGILTTVNSLAVDRTGNLYAAGDFATAGGGAAANIAKWNGSAWAALGTGLNDVAYAVAVTPAGAVFVGGAFTLAGGVANTVRIARWEPTTSAWSALGTGMNGQVNAIAVGLDGRIYAGGSFTTAGGVAINRVAVWNGTAWYPLGSGVNNTVQTLYIDPLTGFLYAGGSFTTAGGLTIPDHFAVWNGSAWIYPDVNFPGTAQIYAIKRSRDGSLIVGYNTTGSAIATGITTVVNTTPSYVYPKLVITGPSSGTSRLYQIVNYTTGASVFFNYTINAGEVATFDFDPNSQSFDSTFSIGVKETVLPGSNPAQFFLVPGNNVIAIYAASSTVACTLSWQSRYNGYADLVN